MDDDAEIRDQIRETLHEYTYLKFVEAAGAYEAIQCLKKNDFDLIISDLVMPDGDGLLIFIQLKKYGKLKTPFILFSGSIAAYSLRNAMNVVEKPDFLKLQNTIKSLQI